MKRANGRHSPWLVVALIVAPILGCTTPERDALPELPHDLSIAVEIEGKEVASIDTARLAAQAPDYVDEHRRAWRLGALLGASYVRADMQIEAEQRDGTRTILARPADATKGRESVLLLNRNGDVLIAELDVGEPFPGFHGRGGNRGRAGDPDRIRDVTRLRVSSMPSR